MTITNCKIDRGSVYADILLTPADIAAAGSPQEAVKTALAALAQENGLAPLIYTRVTAMDAQPDGSLAVSLEGAIPPEVILGPYLGVEVDIGHCEDFEDAALHAAAKNLRVVVPELVIQRKIDTALLEKESELLESLSLNTLADIRAIIADLNDTLDLGLDDEEMWAKALKAAENYIGMGMQDIGAFAQSFDGVLDVDAQDIVRAAERRAYARGGLPAERIAEDVFEAWLRTEGKTREAWRDEQREYAELLSRVDFLLAAVADEEGITAEDDELERAARDLAAQYQMSVDDVIAAVGADAIRHHIRMTKANQIIVENARNK